MPQNPMRQPIRTALDKAVKDAEWLKEDRFSGAVAMTRLLADQIDTLQAVTDPESVKQLNMRIIPNFHRALHGLGLTPEGYAKMTGAGGTNRPGASGAGIEDEGADEMKGKPAATNPLDALMAEAENVVQFRRGE